MAAFTENLIFTQKYAFMGNRDVPEWLLAEVATLSRIVSFRFNRDWTSLTEIFRSDMRAPEIDLQASSQRAFGR
jgi:hypothetical protein